MNYLSFKIPNKNRKEEGIEMSLTKELMKEVCDYIQANSTNIFGQKFFGTSIVEPIQLLIKPEKYETRFYVISKFRIFIVYARSVGNIKIDKSFNILALRQIIINENKLFLSWEDRNCKQFTADIRPLNDDGAKGLAIHTLSTIKHYFSDVFKSLTKFLSISPPELLSLFLSLPTSIPELPCNNFRRSYVTVCDYMDIGFKDEIIWDIERIYFMRGIRELLLGDFQHLPSQDQVALINSIQFSDYFVGIIVENMKISPEHLDAILTVIRRSHSLKKLRLINCSFPKDSILQFSNSLQLNSSLPLEHFEFSGAQNLDERRSIYQFASSLSKIRTLRNLIIKNCGIGEKTMNLLISGLYNGLGLPNDAGETPKLEILCLAQDFVNTSLVDMASLISLCGSTLQLLDLSLTNLEIDQKFWAALKYSGGLRLESFHLRGCHISLGKKNSLGKGKDVLKIIREIFSLLPKLKLLDLTGAVLSPDIFQSILAGISENKSLFGTLQMNLDNIFSAAVSKYVPILTEYLPKCITLASISLRDNLLEEECLKILPILARIPTLTSLNLGGSNFTTLCSANKKHPTLKIIFAELARWMSSNNSNLEELILRDCHLGQHLSVLLNALGVFPKLKKLDLCNNLIGDNGARQLSKSIQLNHSLIHVELDQNQITADGYCNLARALEINKTLCHIPYPIQDMIDVILRGDRQRALEAHSKIEHYLGQNKNLVTSNSNSIIHSFNERCGYETIYSLTNHCEKYNVNESNKNKVTFHKVAKAIMGLVENEDEDLLHIANSRQSFMDLFISNEFESTQKLEERLVKNLRNFGLEAELNLLEHKVSDETNNIRSKYEERFQILVSRYLLECSWTSLLHRLDVALSSTSSPFRAEAVNGSALTKNPVLDQNYFSNSSIYTSDMVQSVTSTEHGRVPTPKKFPNIYKPTSLVHLVKDRPKPARQTKDNNPKPKDQQAVSSSPASPTTTKENHQLQRGLSDIEAESAAIETNMGKIQSSRMSTTPPPVPLRNSGAVLPPELPPRLPTKPKIRSE